MRPTDVYENRGDVEILDVREPREWEAGRIEGARHVPMREVPVHLGELPRNRTIVAVCRSGNRSGRVAEVLRANGFAAENLDGGLMKWAEAGLPILTSDGQPGRVV